MEGKMALSENAKAKLKERVDFNARFKKRIMSDEDLELVNQLLKNDAFIASRYKIDGILCKDDMDIPVGKTPNFYRNELVMLEVLFVRFGTKRDAAKACGIHPSNMSAYLSGNIKMSHLTLKRIKRVYEGVIRDLERINIKKLETEQREIAASDEAVKAQGEELKALGERLERLEALERQRAAKEAALPIHAVLAFAEHVNKLALRLDANLNWLYAELVQAGVVQPLPAPTAGQIEEE